MCRFQVRQGINARIATTNADAAAVLDVPLHKWTTYKDVQVIFFDRTMGEAIKRARGFRQWLKFHVSEFDIVHIHAVFSHICYVAADICRQSKTPYIFRPLGTLDPWSMSQKTWRKNLFLGMGARELLRSATAIQYTTDLELKSTEAFHGFVNGFVVPNGIDTDLYQATSDADVAKNPGKSYLLYLGRIAPKKNIEKILQAFETIKKKAGFVSLRLVIAGDGDTACTTAIRNAISKHPNSTQIEYRGWVTGLEKLELIANAALFVLPSSNENYGVVVAESLASGVPVLISNQVYLYPEVEAAEAGWVWDSESPLAGLIIKALESGELAKRGQNGRDLVAAKFDWPAVVKTLTGVYAGCLEDRG